MKTRRIASITAAVAVVLAMVGAGVYASWSESATATQNLQVGTFGLQIVEPSDGDIDPGGKSVTFTVPEIRDSAASSAPFSFTVESDGEIPIRVDADMTTPPAAPFFGLPVVPDGDTVLHEGETVVFNAGIGWPELGWDELGDVTSVTYTISGTEGDPRGTALAPTTVAKSCNANDGGITIPDAEGVQYLIAGAPVSAGINQRDLGTYQVTAEALPGFDSVLLGYPAGGWSLQVVQDPACVNFTLNGSTVRYGDYGALVTGTPPVVDNVAHTLTWTIPVTSPNTPVSYPYGPYLGTAPSPWWGRFTASIPEGELDVISASATLSPSLIGQESHFQLGYRSTVSGGPFTQIAGIPASIPNLRATSWAAGVGGHNLTDNGLAVQWSGIGTATGIVTITLTFSATA